MCTASLANFVVGAKTMNTLGVCAVLIAMTGLVSSVAIKTEFKGEFKKHSPEENAAVNNDDDKRRNLMKKNSNGYKELKAMIDELDIAIKFAFNRIERLERLEENYDLGRRYGLRPIGQEFME